MELQGKLLRVLQEKEIMRLGGARHIPVDVRIVASSNIDVHRAVAEGKFRADLFYRLNVAPVRIPALRERGDDIMPLAEHFIKAFSCKHGKNICGLDDAARGIFMRYNWPGNVRELKNVLERLVILTDEDRIAAELLPAEMLAETVLVQPVSVIQGRSLKHLKHEHEKGALVRVLAEVRGNITHAARILRVSRNTVVNKINQHGIDIGAYRVQNEEK
jgi:transcriptional regulator with PAS, ATPase and Fis domain